MDLRERDGVLEQVNRKYPLVEDRIQAQIIRLVRGLERPLARSEMAEALGVSRSKISLEVGRLLEVGLLVENGLAESDGGRRSSLLRIPRSAGIIAAVDFGASSIDAALSDLGGDLVAHRGTPADIKDGPRSVLGRAKELLAGLLGEQGSDPGEVLAIGVGVPGPVERASGLLNSPPLMPGWDRYPIRDAFADEYAAPVFVDAAQRRLQRLHGHGARHQGRRQGSPPRGRQASALHDVMGG